MTEPIPSRYGVLLLNMGGPGSLDEVEQYIYSLLADPDMIRLPLGWLLQKPFARMVSRRRAPKVQKRYELIGGKSPIGPTTDKQARLLEQQLDIPVDFAMRYTPPTCADALGRLTGQGCTRFIAIPLYPQYSTVSTLSSVKDLRAQSDGREFRVVERHSANGDYIRAMQEQLSAVLAQTDGSLHTRVLFAAHSIPEAYIQRGDPYAKQIERTAADIIGGIADAPRHSLAYQSQVGPVKWRGPTLEEALTEMVGAGVEQLVVQPLSFVSENLETLYDLDIVFREQCAKAGIRRYHRVPALNDSLLYVRALAGIVRAEISSWEAADA
ncbi:MAG TPA: ferrochelatase [Firmicutes bacterium]|nr:ferrochelatase [Bacillota bacterium]